MKLVIAVILFIAAAICAFNDDFKLALSYAIGAIAWAGWFFSCLEDFDEDDGYPISSLDERHY